MNQADMCRELQRKSDELGVTKGDLVNLALYAICRTETRKLKSYIDVLCEREPVYGKTREKAEEENQDEND